MSPDLTFALIILAPIVILLALRINAVLVFLSLCLGNVLVQFVAQDADDFFALLHATNASGEINATSDTVQLFLLLVPVILTAIFMIRTVRGTSRLLLNVLPAAGVGLLGALLIVPLLPPGLSHNIVDSDLWAQVEKAQNLIVGASALICLFVLWLQRPKTGEGKHGKH